jgi:ribosome biogenesis GTPase
MSEVENLSGLIVRLAGGFFEVHTKQGIITAQLRGKLKQERQDTDLVAIGDRVDVRVAEDGTGVIDRVHERTRVLSRQAPGREVEQVIIANTDQAVFVFACADPDPNFRMLDRFLVVAESQDIPAIICANKIDLVKPRSAREEFGEYERLGYPVLYTSALSGKGIGKLRHRLKDRLSVMAGPSGTGKSSLLNALQPGINLKTQEVREATRKGMHTTVVRQIVILENGGYVADTPGLKAFALWDIEPEEIDAYFPEIAKLVPLCEFSDCSHLHEPGCAVIQAVEQGQISPERYDSYERMRTGERD